MSPWKTVQKQNLLARVVGSFHFTRRVGKNLFGREWSPTHHQCNDMMRNWCYLVRNAVVWGQNCIVKLAPNYKVLPPNHSSPMKCPQSDVIISLWHHHARDVAWGHHCWVQGFLRLASRLAVDRSSWKWGVLLLLPPRDWHYHYLSVHFWVKFRILKPTGDQRSISSNSLHCLLRCTQVPSSKHEML